MVHVPEVGWLIDTVLAVIVPLDDDPLTVTQSPAATEEAGTVAVWVKVVEGVQLTVTWPLCGFWTSMVEPERAATEPEVNGNAAAARGRGCAGDAGHRPGWPASGMTADGRGRQDRPAPVRAGVISRCRALLHVHVS